MRRTINDQKASRIVRPHMHHTTTRNRRHLSVDQSGTQRGALCFVR
jgi:hypothetical protein